MGPVFIIGMPRSGTKLLRDILNRHPLISIPKAETGFLPYCYKNRASYGDLREPDNFHRFFESLKESSFFYYMGESKTIWDEKTLYDNVASYTVEGIIEQIYAMHAASEGKTVWGDKTPDYLHHTRLIKKLFPKTLFIHIIRDARDYCLSVRKAWKKNIYRAAQKWSDGIEKARNDMRPHQSDYFELKYEDLIAYPDAQVGKLCNWLKIDFHKEMLTFDRPVENIGSTKANKEIVRTNFDKWKTELKPGEVSKIESIAGSTLGGLGYEIAHCAKNDRLSKLENMAYYLLDVYNLFQYRSGVMDSKKDAVMWLVRDFKNKLSQ